MFLRAADDIATDIAVAACTAHNLQRLVLFPRVAEHNRRSNTQTSHGLRVDPDLATLTARARMLSSTRCFERNPSSETRRADEHTVIFAARFIPKSLYLAEVYCIAFRK
jgi:hypothetical protein